MEIVRQDVVWKLEELANLMLGKPMDDLTSIEREAFHLCRIVGLVYGDFGPDGTLRGRIVKNKEN